MDFRVTNNVAANITNFQDASSRVTKTINSAVQGETAEGSLNAFGIGSANKPEVELSPQARILQQNEAQQRERQESQNEEQDDSNALSGNEFVRVSSSVGSAQKNNLSTEKATEVYQSIQKLL